MMYRYRAFGLSVASDFPIIEFLPEADDTVPVDVTIQAGDVPVLVERACEGTPSSLTLNIKEVVRFLITDGSQILYTLEPQSTVDSLRLFLLGTGFSGLLHQRGMIVLHGNCVSTDGQTCQIYVGDSGAGKSTMAAWHYQQGDFILADDVCAITFNDNHQPIVFPSFPQLKLWQASADLLGVDTVPLRRVRPQDAKFALPIPNQYWATPLPLTHIYELKPEHGMEIPYTGMEKMDILVRNTYRHHFVTQMQMTKPYLKALMTLATKVEAFSAVRKTI